ncbi:MAG: hypothetical protein BWK75_04405 [Candidatus Altiarchaeales archaeon A3]|nr:MAG: hypothetical protein BWK75_04405 [Candidatus Altiarchaeales archaeon A3]
MARKSKSKIKQINVSRRHRNNLLTQNPNIFETQDYDFEISKILKYPNDKEVIFKTQFSKRRVLKISKRSEVKF